MKSQRLARLLQFSITVLITTAVIHELSQPVEARHWHGKVLLIPYDFRAPTWERIKDTLWNPYEKRVLVPVLFGLGWALNLYSILESIGIVRQADISEESFLLPNERMKQLLRPQKV